MWVVLSQCVGGVVSVCGWRCLSVCVVLSQCVCSVVSVCRWCCLSVGSVVSVWVMLSQCG